MNRQIKWALTFLLVATAGMYARLLNAPFFYDDFPMLVDNPVFQGATTLAQLLHAGYLETRPLTVLSNYACFWLGGMDPGIFHAFNILLHLLNGLLLWFFLRTLPNLERAWPQGDRLPLTALGIFLLHPLQTEAVAYTYSRAVVLMTFFVLTALNSFLRFRLTSSRRQKSLWFIATLLSCIAAMASKENGALAPILIWGIDLIFLRSYWEPRMRRTHLTIAATLLTLPILFQVFKNSHGGTIGFKVEDGGWIIANQSRVLAFYLLSFVAPLWQNVDHSFPLIRSLTSPALWLSWLSMAGGLAFLIWQRRSWSTWAFGWLWFLITLAPTNSFIPFHDFVAERHLYIPMIGLGIAVGWVAEAIAQAPLRWKRVTVLLAVFFGGWLLTRTSQRLDLWSSEAALWGDAAKKSPNKPRVWFNWGAALIADKQPEAAQKALETADRLAPNDSATLYNLGLALKQQGKIDPALQHFQRATLLAPDSASPYAAAAELMAEQGEAESGLTILQQGLNAGADPVRLGLSQARILEKSDQFIKAIDVLEALAARYPHLVVIQAALENLKATLAKRPNLR